MVRIFLLFEQAFPLVMTRDYLVTGSIFDDRQDLGPPAATWRAAPPTFGGFEAPTKGRRRLVRRILGGQPR
jgi:hypothetical protein